MPIIDRLITIPEAAKLAGISERSFWDMVKSDRTPQVVRLGRSVRMRASDFDIWIQLGCPSREQFETEKNARTQKEN